VIRVETITRFDGYLAERGLQLDAVVVGGAALALLGVIARPTRDCDILHPDLPPEILDAARGFAARCSKEGEPLDDEWLNNGPSSLTRLLPVGWQDRVQVVFNGEAITLHTLGRLDLLRTKLFGLCDRGLDLGDCIALAPTPIELRELLPWLQEQDAHPGWPEHVETTLADLARKLGHEL
jgi:hypothetical protein